MPAVGKRHGETETTGVADLPVSICKAGSQPTVETKKSGRGKPKAPTVLLPGRTNPRAARSCAPGGTVCCILRETAIEEEDSMTGNLKDTENAEIRRGWERAKQQPLPHRQAGRADRTSQTAQGHLHMFDRPH